MAINFPASPATNDTYTFSGKTWVWNGYAWALKTTALPGLSGNTSYLLSNDGNDNWSVAYIG